MAEDILVAKSKLLRLSNRVLDRLKSTANARELAPILIDLIYILEKVCLLLIRLKKASASAEKNDVSRNSLTDLSAEDGGSSRETSETSGLDPWLNDVKEIASVISKCVFALYHYLLKTNSAKPRMTTDCVEVKTSKDFCSGRCEGCAIHLSRLVFDKTSTSSSTMIFCLLTTLEVLVEQADCEIMVRRSPIHEMLIT